MVMYEYDKLIKQTKNFYKFLGLGLVVALFTLFTGFSAQDLFINSVVITIAWKVWDLSIKVEALGFEFARLYNDENEPHR